MENLFMQIFDRRRWIEGQLRPQIESYVQSLAYNLLADGRRPPTWLWPSGSDASNFLEAKEIGREQLISEILLPLPRATTPRHCSTLLPLPTVKGNNVTHFSSSFASAQIDETLPIGHSKDGEQNPGMVDFEAAEACEFDPLTGIQRYTLKHRELNNHHGNSAKARNIEDSSNINKRSGILNSSRVALVNSDSDKESLARKNLLVDQIQDGAHKAQETQSDVWQVASGDADNPIIDGINDAMTMGRCAEGNLTTDLVSEALHPVVSESKMASAVTSGLCKSHSLVEPKKLSFDGIEDGFNENLLSSLDKNTPEFSPSVVPFEMDNLQVLQKQYNYIYSTKGNGSLAGTQILEDVLHAANIESIDEAGRVINGSPEGRPEMQGGDSDYHCCPASWPKKRKKEYGSNNVLATSPRMRLKPVLHFSEGSDKRCKASLEDASRASVEILPLQLAGEMQTGLTPNSCENRNSLLASQHLLGMLAAQDKVAPSSNSKGVNNSGSSKQLMEPTAHGVPKKCKKQCDEEGSFCLDGNNLAVASPLPLECTQEDQFPILPNRSPQTSLTKQWEAAESTFHKLIEHGTAEYYHDLYDEDLADCDGTIPVFEGFSIGIPPNMEDGILYDSDIPILDTERTSILEQQPSSRNLVAQRSCPSSKHKINRVPDFYQSLPAGLMEHLKLSDCLHFKDSDMEQFGTDENVKISRLGCSIGTEFDDFCTGRFYSQSLPSSDAKFRQEGNKLPLTPSVEKYSERKVTGRRASSETLCSNPELICFRIDENASTAEENDHSEELFTSEKQADSKRIKLSTDRKALQDVTSMYQNTQSSVTFKRNSLESIGTESYSVNRKGSNLSLRSACASNRISKVKDKKKHNISVNGNRVRKAAESLCNRSSQAELSGKAGQKNSSRMKMEKGCIPNNIVSNISSFIPLVRQKQEITSKKGKRDIKVKALEVAEAAKRLEEKKQNERDLRKAAAKLERERLEQEKELKQKKEGEEKKKKERDVAAKKRQREEEERMEKARKRRCNEEARKMKRDKEEGLFAEKGDKDIQHKAPDQKEHIKKELTEVAKRQLISKGGEQAAGDRTIAEEETSTIEVLAGNEKRDNNGLEFYDASKELNGHEKLYEMSPYKDSDDDDYDDGEEEIRRQRKHVPSWARRECLEKIILSNQHLNPNKIFCRKSSFKLNDVLLPHSLRRPLL